MENIISIIIPVYKVEKYIERCLLSVMNQRCQSISIECIIVDDCSPDGSMQIAKKLIENYSGPIQFEMVSHDKNQGLSAARNTGMSLAKGDYFLFIDSDDYITDDCIQKLTDVVRQNPEVEVVKGNHQGRVDINLARVPQGPLSNDQLLELLYTGIIPVMAWNTLIKKSLVEKWGLSFKVGLIQEDVLWTNLLFRHVNSFVFIPDVTYYYESNPQSILGVNKDPCQTRYMSHRIDIVDVLMALFDTRHFGSFTCYLVSNLMQIYDQIDKGEQIEKENILHVRQLRNRLVKNTFQHFHFVLLVYELMLYMPFRLLMRVRFFRHHYSKLEKMVVKIV